MSYESVRDLEIDDRYKFRIERFASRYRPGKPTVILLPGGMGSQLDRTNEPYENDSSRPFSGYDTVWIDPGILSGDALYLKIKESGQDMYDYIVAPDGAVYFDKVKPYDGTEDYFRKLGYNFAVFGYDWRRSLKESADYLHKFLRLLRDRVKKRGKEDPLPTTTLLCHSMGGLVAKVFAHRVFKPVRHARKRKRTASTNETWFANLVTVGTPFYGTSDHMTRYYKGDEILNELNNYTARKVAEITGSLRGPYILLFLDRDAYNGDGPRLGLPRYPVRDADDPSSEADPYDPKLVKRYPRWVSQQCLGDAKLLRDLIAQPFPVQILGRVFHLRSGQDKRTWTELYWKAVRGNEFNPEKDPSPISGKTGPGDGTVPHWAARHAHTPDSQVYDLRKASKHVELAEHQETLDVVKFIIENGRLPRRRLRVPDKSLAQRKASTRTVQLFLKAHARGKIKSNDPRWTDPKVWRRIVADARLC